MSTARQTAARLGESTQALYRLHRLPWTDQSLYHMIGIESFRSDRSRCGSQLCNRRLRSVFVLQGSSWQTRRWLVPDAQDPLPAEVPGPGNPEYDSGNMHGAPPRIAPAPKPPPGPPPSHPPGPPPPPRPPPPPTPPTPPPYNGHTWPTTTTEAKAISSALLHEALAPYLICATESTWFSYAWFYGVQTGWAPCPSNPGARAAPDEWYPDLRKPIGKPMAAAVKQGTV